MTDLSSYHNLIERKRVAFAPRGFADYGEIKGELFAHQLHGVEFALRAGCAAHFYDTGLGKSRIAMAWAQKIIERTNRPVLMLAPLAVAAQHLVEAQAFGVEAVASRLGTAPPKPCIAVTNYERLERFDPADYAAVILDESSILKSYAGATSRKLIEAFQSTPYRLACSATPAPNDHMEIGQQCEFLGVMDQSLMLQRWFINDTKTASKNWRLKKHAAASFWDWVASWARCVTKPSDLGFSDVGFEMPQLNIYRHIIEADRSTDTGVEKKGKHEGQFRLFRIPDTSATSIHREKRLTVEMRAAKVAEIIAREPDETWVIWCDTDYEEEALTETIPNIMPIRGSMTIDMKEERLAAFTRGEVKKIVTKCRIAGHGLNWQHCARTAYVGLSFCFDEETEILTHRGWLPFGAVSLNDEVAAIDPMSLEMRWEKPTYITWEKYSGEMVRFSCAGSRSCDLLVTPNHRMLVRECAIRYPSRNENWHFREATQIAETWKRQELRIPCIPKIWNGKYLETTTIPVPDNYRKSSRSKIVESLTREQLLKLAGWYLSEGHIRKSNNILVISQTDLHLDHRIEIINLLKELGLNVNCRTKDIYACSKNLCEWLVSEFGKYSRGMKIPQWLKDADVEALKLLRDTMMKGDGAATGRYYRSYSKTLQDDFQEICLKTGVKATVRPDWGGVMIGYEFLEPSLSTRPTIEFYEGMIGCVTVPSGAIQVRRNGRPVITGNSYEQFYQTIRRFWRFRQKRDVEAHIVCADTEVAIMDAVNRKAAGHDEMKAEMIGAMRRTVGLVSRSQYTPIKNVTVPNWLGAA